MAETNNNYAKMLAEQGKTVITESDIDWVKYGYFMIPAYLPHQIPSISLQQAKQVLKVSGCPFVRWESDIEKEQETEWWYIVKRGPWTWDECTSKTRNRIRRAQKYGLRAERVSPNIILKEGYDVCAKAVIERFKRKDFLPNVSEFQKRIGAAKVYQDNLHFFGIFEDKKLVGFAENYIQDEAVFWESIWYDPEYLSKHASFLLIHQMLEYYLNELSFSYINDGSRNIYHKTNVHDFMTKVFGFRKEYANLNILYAPLFNTLVRLCYTCNKLIDMIDKKWETSLVSKIAALMLQEKIRRSCLAE